LILVLVIALSSPLLKIAKALNVNLELVDVRGKDVKEVEEA